MQDKRQYASYLLTRRWTGLAYRYLFIYPFFLRFLGKKNLDFGCGIGDFLGFCNLFKKKIIGVDINPFNIDVCKKRSLDAMLLTKNMLIQLGQGSFDTIVLDNVLEHILFPQPTLKNINALLKDHGLLIVGIPVGDAGFKADEDHKVFYDEQGLDELLKGYNLIKMDHFYRPFNNGILRKNLRQFCYYSVYRKMR